jgi:hypothetical protein
MAPARTYFRRTAFSLPLALAIALAADARHALATDLSGCWTGTWCSSTSGHRGPLQASFCRINAAQYQVEFRGRFFKILPFHYSVTLDVVSDDGQSVELAGDSYLGRMFGTFHYQAQANECEFTANYSSCEDRGRFEMRRTCCRKVGPVLRE